MNMQGGTGFELSDAVDSVAHIVQVALTPVFLLSGIGTLLNMLNTRQARVSDHLEHAADLLKQADSGDGKRLRAHMARLHHRMLAMDAAVVLGALGGAATCGAALVLFVGGVRDAAVASWLVALFGMALLCTVGALVAFLADTLLAWHGLRLDGPMPHMRGDGHR